MGIDQYKAEFGFKTVSKNYGKYNYYKDITCKS